MKDNCRLSVKKENEENMKSVVIFCLLGDPMVPPTSEPSRAGGYNIDVKQWLKHISGSSINITVITNLSSHFSKAQEKLSSSITLYRVGICENSLKNGQALMEQYALVHEEIMNIFNSKGVEPLFFHSFYWYNGLLAKDFSIQYGVPFVHTIIDMAAYKLISGDNLSFMRQFDIEKEIFSKATYLFAITITEKEILLKNYPVRAEKVIVTGREADEVFLHPDHDSYGQSGVSTISRVELEDRFLGLNNNVLNKWWNIGAFMYYGRLVEMKGIRYIIKAWYDLYLRYNGDIPPLWIVGGIPTTISAFRKTLDKDIPIDKLENNQQLCWWGSLSQRSIRTLMMKSCAVIMHSQHESGGLVVLEALAAGLPIIATATGFAKDIIEDWHAGFKTNYADSSLLAYRMEHFIQQPLLSRCMGISASELYCYIQKNWHPFDRMDKVYENLYEGESDECFADIATYTGRNSLMHRRLNEVPPLEMQKDWIVQTMQTSLNNDNLVDSMVLLENESSAADIWKVWTQRSTYIAKRIYSVLNPLRFLFQDEPLGFPSIDRFGDSLISMHSKNVVRPFACSEAHHMIILPAAKVVDFEKVDTLYDAITLLKLFHTDMSSIDRNEITRKPPMSQIRLINELFNEISYLDCRFLKQYNGKLSTLREHAFSGEIHNGLMYGKSTVGHLVQLDNKKYLLPSAEIRFGDQNIDYAFTIIDYLLRREYSNNKDTCHIITMCAEIIGITPRSLFISLGFAIVLLAKKNYVLYSYTENNRVDELLEYILSML